MDAQRVNEITVLLEGVALPAKRKELVEYAAHEDKGVAAQLRQLLPDQEFDRLDAVGEVLMRPPQPPDPPRKVPAPESGKPPGGADYVNPSPESGAVKRAAPRTHPTTVALEEQTKLQKKQKAKQEGG